MLNTEKREKLLKLARNSITNYLKTGKLLNVTENDPELTKNMGAFVTLRKEGELRGCIGNLVATDPLYITVRDMAVEAAIGDPRFSAARLSEMNNIDIGISALSPMEKINDSKKIEVGKHGVLVKSGFSSGVYLPQVATETGWSLEEFMNSLCGQKAGMEKDAWKKGTCEMYIFTAQVFGEKK